MPGLLRGIARTAVIAGTATSVSNRVSRRQGERWARQGYYDEPEPQPQQQQQYAPPPAAPAPDPIAQLKELGELHTPGHPHRRGVRGAEGEDPGLAPRSDTLELLDREGAIPARGGQRRVVALVLVGVRRREGGERLVEAVAAAEVGGDRETVS